MSDKERIESMEPDEPESGRILNGVKEYTLKKVVLRRLYLILTGVLMGLLLIGLIIASVVAANAGGSNVDGGQVTESTSTITPSNLTTTTPDPFGEGPWELAEIGKDVIPTRQFISARIDVSKNLFYGDTKIYATNKKANNIYLLVNVDKKLTVEDPEVFLLGDEGSEPQQIRVNSSFFYPPNEYFVIEITQPLAVDAKIRIDLQYERNIGVNDEEGLYARRFFDSTDSIKQQVVFTNFGNKKARKVIPCFDTPKFKLQFDLILEHDTNQIPLSSYPIESQETIQPGIDPNYLIFQTKFNLTKEMSIDYLGWILLPNATFTLRHMGDFEGHTLNIYAQKSFNVSSWPINIVTFALNHLKNELFVTGAAIPPKIDLVAMPDLSDEAVNSVGLMLFGETHFMDFAQIMSPYEEQVAALAFAKSIAQLWLGYLVTPASWSEYWFYDALTDILKYKVTSSFNSDLFADDNEYYTTLVRDMWDDLYSVRVADPRIKTKYVSLMRTLSSILGKDEFYSKIKAFVQNHEFSNGMMVELLESLQLPSSFGVSTLDYIESWLNEPNYPLVFIDLKNQGAKSTVNFRQMRFANEDSKKKANSREQHEWVVLLECSAGGIYNSDPNNSDQHFQGTVKNFTFVLKQQLGEIEFDINYSWVKCNEHFNGFYVIKYSDQAFRSIKSILDNKPETFSPIDRAYIINDLYLISGSSEELLDAYQRTAMLTSYIRKNENDYLPLTFVETNLIKLSYLLKSRPAYGDLVKFTGIIFDRINITYLFDFNSVTKLDLLLKHRMIDFFSIFQNRAVLERLNTEFRKLAEDGYFSQPTNNRFNGFMRILFRNQIRNEDRFSEDWNLLANLHEITNNPLEKYFAMRALASSTKPFHLNILLAGLDKDRDTKGSIRVEFFSRLLQDIGENYAGRFLFFDFLDNGITSIVDRYGSGSVNVGNILLRASNTYETPVLIYQVNFIQVLVGTYLNPADLDKIVNKIVSNIAWIILKDDKISVLFNSN